MRTTSVKSPPMTRPAKKKVKAVKVPKPVKAWMTVDTDGRVVDVSWLQDYAKYVVVEAWMWERPKRRLRIFEGTFTPEKRHPFDPRRVTPAPAKRRKIHGK